MNSIPGVIKSHCCRLKPMFRMFSIMSQSPTQASATSPDTASPYDCNKWTCSEGKKAQKFNRDVKFNKTLEHLRPKYASMFPSSSMSYTMKHWFVFNSWKVKVEDAVRRTERETKQLEARRGRWRVCVCSAGTESLNVVGGKKLKVKLKPKFFWSEIFWVLSENDVGSFIKN